VPLNLTAGEWAPLDRVTALALAAFPGVSADAARAAISSALRSGDVLVQVRTPAGTLRDLTAGELRAGAISVDAGTVRTGPAVVRLMLSDADGAIAIDSGQASLTETDSGEPALVNLPQLYRFLRSVFGAAEAAPPKHPGGRKPKHDWRSIVEEAYLWILEHGLPSSKAELTRHVVQWCAETFLEPPDERAIERVASAAVEKARVRIGQRQI